MAELAMLELNEVEIALYQADLNRFLQSGAELRKVNTQEVRLSSPHVGRASSRMREDVIQRSLPQEKALRNGPCVVDGCFRAPRVMEDVR